MLSAAFDPCVKPKEMAMRKIFYAVAATVMLFALSACNTVRGAGQDVEEVGEAIQDTTN